MIRLKAAGVMVALLVATPALAQEVRQLTLDDALALARERNRGLQIADFQVREHQRKSRQAFADYFPKLETEMIYSRVDETESVLLPEGSLGSIAGGPFPDKDLSIPQSDEKAWFGVTTLSQPLTQFIEIGAAHRLARAELDQSRADRRRAELELDYVVRQLYFELLVSENRREATELALEAAQGKLRDRQDAVVEGTVLVVEEIDARASTLEARQEFLTITDHIADVSEQLADILGLPLDTQFELAPVIGPGDILPLTSFSTYYAAALEGNPEIASARALVEGAEGGVTAAWGQYVPDVALFGQHAFQDGVSFLPDQLWMLGFKLTWDVFDFGKREAVLGERRAALSRARLTLIDAERRIEREVHASYRRLERARHMLEVGREAASVRAESARLRIDQVDTGFLVAWESTRARADAVSAQADLLEVELGYRLALADLERLVGRPLTGLPLDE